MAEIVGSKILAILEEVINENKEELEKAFEKDKETNEIYKLVISDLEEEEKKEHFISLAE